MTADKGGVSQVKDKVEMPADPECKGAERIYPADKTIFPVNKSIRKKTDERLAGYYVQLFFLS